MAIQFARIEIVSRSKGGNACCKSAYNARSIVKDERTNVTYNFSKRGDNVYHQLLLPDHVDKKFQDLKYLMNAIEIIERKGNSQLLKDIVIALPDDKELDLNDRIEITHRIVERMNWVKDDLGVQIDIHKPHDGERNWHAHVLVTTRRFSKDGKSLGEKARDLNPEFKSKGGNNFIIAEQVMIHEHAKEVINEYFKELGLANRVDAIGEIGQEHLGPVRMRKAVNAALVRNEERAIANVESLDSGKELLRRITKTVCVFSENDVRAVAQIIPEAKRREQVIKEALASKELIRLCDENGKENGLYTTKEVREEEKRILRISEYVAKKENILANLKGTYGLGKYSPQQQQILKELVIGDGGIRILRGRAGTGKSRVLGEVATIAQAEGIEIIGLAPTNKAKGELEKVGYSQNYTVKGFMFKLMNGKIRLAANSIVVVDEAGMVGNRDYSELMREVLRNDANLILAGDERQLSSMERSGMFEILAKKHNSCLLSEVKRQSSEWAREVATAMAIGEVTTAIEILEGNKKLYNDNNPESSIARLLTDWEHSKWSMNEKLIIAVSNKNVDALNLGARELLKAKELLTGKEYRVTDKEGKELIKIMVGERIVFTATNKELAINNGDFASIEYISKEEIRVRLDKTNEVTSFEPKQLLASIKYGYASTVYKAQGASIKDVYVLHNGRAGLRNSYVALSRHVEELGLYSNYKKTADREALVSQLSHYGENRASICYFTKEELAKREKEQGEKGIIGQLVAKAGKQVTRIVDNYRIDREYYQYELEETKYGAIEEVVEKELDAVAEYVNSNEKLIANKQILIGGNITGEMAVGAELSEGVGIRAVGDVGNVRNMGSVGGTRGAGNRISSERELRGREINNKAMPTTTIAETGIVEGATTGIAEGATTGIAEGAGTTAESANQEIAMSDEQEKGNIITSNKQNNQENSKLTSKEKFYAKVEYRQKRNLERIKAQDNAKESYKQEVEKLRHIVNSNADSISRILLGEVNEKLSNGTSLRYGEHGKIAVSISGAKAGTWYDFATSKGGDMFDLVQEVRGGDFKEAVEHLQQICGVSRKEKLARVEQESKVIDYEHYLHKQKDKAQEQTKVDEAKEIDAIEIRLAGLIARSKRIGDKSVAYRYLDEQRKIDCGLGDDIRTTGIYVSELGKSLPAIVAFARNELGEITGGQQIMLDSETGKKAEIAVNKRSFGKISGSFVEIAKQQETKEKQITIIAEGLETALSIKQAGIDANIICSLGVSNIKNYPAKEGEYIIVAGDNDGKGSNSYQAVARAIAELEVRKAIVQAVEPKEQGDFNDILQDKGKEQGIKEIRELFAKPLDYYRAKTISELANHMELGIQERKKIKEHEEILIKHNIKQEKIVDSFRVSTDLGVKRLEAVTSNIALIEQVIDEGKGDKLIAEISTLRDRKQPKELTREEVKLALIASLHSGVKEKLGGEEAGIVKENIEEKDIVNRLANKRDELLRQLVVATGKEFTKEKAQATDLASLGKVLAKEQQALADIYAKHKEGVESAYGENSQERQGLEQAGNKELVQEVLVRAGKLVANDIVPESKIMTYLKGHSDITAMHKDLTVELENKAMQQKFLEFAHQKLEAKDMDGYIACVQKENEYLATVKVANKYTEHYEEKLLSCINYGYQVHNSNMMSELGKVSKHLVEHNILPEQEVGSKVHRVCCASDLEELTKLTDDFKKLAYEQHAKLMNKGLKEIEQTGQVIARGNKFTSRSSYIRHELKSPSHEFVDTARLQKGLQRIVKHEQLEKQKQIELAKVHHYGK